MRPNGVEVPQERDAARGGRRHGFQHTLAGLSVQLEIRPLETGWTHRRARRQALHRRCSWREHHVPDVKCTGHLQECAEASTLLDAYMVGGRRFPIVGSEMLMP